MGRVEKIETIVNGVLNTYSHLKIIPRGTAFLLDRLLTGEKRFSKTIGNDTSLLISDVQFKIKETFGFNQTKLVSTPPKWAVLGAIVESPTGELEFIDDIFFDGIQISNPMREVYPTGSRFTLHSFPFFVVGNHAKGQDEVLVKSSVKLANGDVFGYFLSNVESPYALAYSEIQLVTYIGTTPDPIHSLLYKLKLSENLLIDVIDKQKSYLRYFPAYFSNQIPLPPTEQGYEQIGPILLDTHKGRMKQGKNKDFVSIKVNDRGGRYIRGSAFEFENIKENHSVAERQISHSVFCFADRDTGFLKQTNIRSVFSAEDGKVRFIKRFFPALFYKVATSYRFSLKADFDCNLRIIFGAFSFDEVLIANIAIQRVIPVPAMSYIELFEVNAVSDNKNFNLEMSDLVLSSSGASKISYSLLSHEVKEEDYQTTGLLLKPHEFDRHSLVGRWDTAFFDRGFLFN